jgi:hypothetical protein
MYRIGLEVTVSRSGAAAPTSCAGDLHTPPALCQLRYRRQRLHYPRACSRTKEGQNNRILPL